MKQVLAFSSPLVVLVSVDIWQDVHAGIGAGHVALELAIVAASLLCAIALRRREHAAAVLADRLEAERDRTAEARDALGERIQDLLRGLGEVIDEQFTTWGLSPAEREVGLLLLKGLSHKEVARVRSTSERTVRQQALTLYRKASVRSRAELSAFFLEDLLLPTSPAPAEPDLASAATAVVSPLERPRSRPSNAATSRRAAGSHGG